MYLLCFNWLAVVLWRHALTENPATGVCIWIWTNSFATATLCTKDLRPIILRLNVAWENDSTLSPEVWFGFKTEICQTVGLVKLFRHFFHFLYWMVLGKCRKKMAEQFHQSHCLTYFSLEYKPNLLWRCGVISPCNMKSKYNDVEALPCVGPCWKCLWQGSPGHISAQKLWPFGMDTA